MRGMQEWRSSNARRAIMGTIYSLSIVILLSLVVAVQARVTGVCVNCHTMHNSQDGLAITETGTPNPALLLADCIGCHTGQNDGSNITPFVFDTVAPQYKATGSEPDSNTLAGGNFYWMASIGDSRGHNVFGLAAPDATLSLPPGGDGTFNSQLRCAGSMGCHGRQDISTQIIAMKGTHHYKDHSIFQDGSTLARSYRFLDTTQGFEDPDYEFHPDYQHHNKYYGVDRTTESNPALGTISAQCARCHTYFHNGAESVAPSSTFGTGVWIRHPTDFNMGSATSSNEYRGYNGGSGTGNTYSVISPVASADISTTINSTIYTRTDDSVVMCLSCHRAHGTPYNGMLRWNYKAWPGGGFNGCAVCHSSKD